MHWSCSPLSKTKLRVAAASPSAPRSERQRQWPAASVPSRLCGLTPTPALPLTLTLTLTLTLGGAVHPLIHTHVRSGRPSLFLHLAMTGAVIHVASREPSGHHSSTGGAGEAGRTGLEEDALTRGKSSPVQPGPVEWTALDDEEVASLLTRVSEVLSDRRAAYHHSYTAGDLILIDNCKFSSAM